MVADSSSAVALICSADLRVDLAGAGLLGDHRQLLRGRLSLLERLGLLLDRRLGFVGGGGLLLRRTGDQQSAFFGFACRMIGFQRAGQGFLAALRYPLHVFAQAIQHRHDGGAGLRLADRRLGGLLQGGGDIANVGLDRGRKLLDVLRALLRGLGERAHLVGHHREAAAMIARPRRLDRGIEGEQVGLVRNPADGAGDLADILGAPLELGDEPDRGALAKAVAFDGAHRGADLDRGFRQHDLDGFRAPARGFRLRARDGEAGDDLLDGRQLLLRGAGRLAGAAGDLLHRSAQFFRRGRRFGEAAGQLFRGRRETLRYLVLGAGGNALAGAVRAAVCGGRADRRRVDDPLGCSGVQLGFLDESHGVPWNRVIRTMRAITRLCRETARA